MKSFPMFICTTGRQVVIVGGGEQAAQKARLILKTDAQIVLVADQLDEELSALVKAGQADHVQTLTPEIFDNAAMAFVGTGCPALDSAAHALAKAARCPVNVVDRPELCDITTPAIVDRDPVIVAIGSEGTAPILTREIKTKVETMLSPRLGALAALAGRLRPAVAQAIPQDQRRGFWGWVFRDAPRIAWARGAEREAASAIKQALANGKAPDADRPGLVSIIDAGPGPADLLTLRAVQRLQEADIIFVTASVPQEILELARRDAERVVLTPTDQRAIRNKGLEPEIMTRAQKGQRVVRLALSGEAEVITTAPMVSDSLKETIVVEIERLSGVVQAPAKTQVAASTTG